MGRPGRHRPDGDRRRGRRVHRPGPADRRRRRERRVRPRRRRVHGDRRPGPSGVPEVRLRPRTLDLVCASPISISASWSCGRSPRPTTRPAGAGWPRPGSCRSTASASHAFQRPDHGGDQVAAARPDRTAAVQAAVHADRLTRAAQRPGPGTCPPHLPEPDRPHGLPGRGPRRASSRSWARSFQGSGSVGSSRGQRLLREPGDAVAQASPPGCGWLSPSRRRRTRRIPGRRRPGDLFPHHQTRIIRL